MAVSTLTTKGQITLPKDIRNYLHLSVGDKVEFIVGNEGQVILSPKTLNLSDIVGMVKRYEGVSIEDMNRSIARTIQKKWDNKSE